MEVKKALNRLGENLEIPQDCVYMCPKDYYVNIPCIYHSTDDTQNLVDKTIEALNMITKCLHERNNEEVLSFTLAWDVEDKEIRVCVIGMLKILNTWFKSTEPIPTERTSFKKWLKQQQEYCSNHGNPTVTPVLSEITQSDGVLYFKRRLTENDVDLKVLEGSPMGLEVNADESKKDLMERLSEKKIFIAPSMIIEEVICLNLD